MPVRNRLKAVLVGVGPGAFELVTPEAREIISRAEIILGWDMDLLPVRDCVAGKKVFLQDVRNYVQATRAAVREAKRTRKLLAVPRVGDPCLSSCVPWSALKFTFIQESVRCSLRPPMHVSTWMKARSSAFTI